MQALLNAIGDLIAFLAMVALSIIAITIFVFVMGALLKLGFLVAVIGFVPAACIIFLPVVKIGFAVSR